MSAGPGVAALLCCHVNWTVSCQKFKKVNKMGFNGLMIGLGSQ
jgi:hypothetical protein